MLTQVSVVNDNGQTDKLKPVVNDNGQTDKLKPMPHSRHGTPTRVNAPLVMTYMYMYDNLTNTT